MVLNNNRDSGLVHVTKVNETPLLHPTSEMRIVSSRTQTYFS